MVKVAISIPESTPRAVEEARKKTGESRSEFLRRAADIVMAQERERLLVEQYVEAYRKYPETAEEIAQAEAGIQLVFAENPWDESPGGEDAAR